MAEFAGLAVGIIPLVHCVVKGYRKLNTGFSSIRNYSKEIKNFTIKVDLQKVFFDAMCEEILSEVVEQHIAVAMVANDTHPSWSSDTVKADVVKLLGPNVDLWMRSISLVEDKIEDLDARTTNLVEGLKIEKIRSKEKHQGLDQWAADFSRKAKTHLQKTGLEQSLRDMKEHLAYLEKLCSKTIGSRKAAQSSYKYQQNVRGNSIHSYGPTRQASQVLYNVLLGACNKHSEHRIHLCVEVKQPTLTMRSEFLFTLAFSHLDAEMEPLWLEVKTLVDEVTQPGERLSGSALGDCLSEKLSHADQELPANESQKRRQLTMQLKPTVIESDQHALNRPVSSSGEVSIDGNICEFLRRWCPLQHETVQCVGILPRLSCWKCIVSPARAPHKHKSLRPMSLSKLISLIAKQDDLRILMIGERIRLARLLTTALLRYYSTNWSLACCQSEQIHLFDINEAEPLKPMKLTYPHLAARIQSSNGTHSVQPGEDKLKRVKGAPNTEFFYLSILLLQIAHGKNWARLQEENPLRIDIYGEDAEYDRVLDLARRRDSGMPPRYHQAIVNLLKCSAIESEVVEGRIQEIVHQDVIMPLEELEKLSLED